MLKICIRLIPVNQPASSYILSFIVIDKDYIYTVYFSKQYTGRLCIHNRLGLHAVHTNTSIVTVQVQRDSLCSFPSSCVIPCYISDVCLYEWSGNLDILGHSSSDKALSIIDKFKLEN